MHITPDVDCATSNCVYNIECKKNRLQTKIYWRDGERIKGDNIKTQTGYIHNKNITHATGAHFNLPGHSLSDMKVTILEKVKINDEACRKERESYHIRNCITFIEESTESHSWSNLIFYFV